MSEKLAIWLSRLFHPFLVSLVALGLILYLGGISFSETVRWVSISTVVVIVPAGTLILFNVKRGTYSDIDVSVREQRGSLYALGICCLLLLLVLSYILDGPILLRKCLAAASIATVIGALVNHFLTKISLHSGVVAGTTAVLFWLSPLLGIILGLIGISVGWARVQLRHHTSMEVAAAWILAFVSVAVVFQM